MVLEKINSFNNKKKSKLKNIWLRRSFCMKNLIFISNFKICVLAEAEVYLEMETSFT